MTSRADSVAVLVGGALILTGIGAYSWRAALIAAGLMLVGAAVVRRKESR